MTVGGFSTEAASGSTTKKNHTLVGMIPGGAQVEVAAPTQLPQKQIALILKEPDFTTATRLRDAIVSARGPNTARVGDSATVVVPIPANADVSQLIAELEPLEVDPDVRAKVIVDEKTGTVVIGEAVTLRPAAITFGSLTVEIAEEPIASQPGPLAARRRRRCCRAARSMSKKRRAPLRVLNRAATVGDVAAALGALGAKPRDLVSILRALHAAGALRADLESL